MINILHLRNYKTRLKMKRVLSIMLFSVLGVATYAQLPDIALKDLDGNSVRISELKNDGKPIVINFWATWCKPCVLELNTIQDDFEEIQKETGVRFIAVSIDDSRNEPKIAPFVKSKAWPYEILLDPNEELKRSLSVQNPPHTFVIDGNGKVVWQHMGYTLGDESVLFEVLRKVARGESVEK